MSKRIIISADHGLAVIYFLQSDVVSTLIEGGYEVVLLTDDDLVGKVNDRFSRPGLIVEGLRLEQLKTYEKEIKPSIQWWFHFLRRAGASNRINLEAVDGFINQVKDDAHSRRKILFPIMRVFIAFMRRSLILRKIIFRLQNLFTPGVYSDLFERYQPALVVAATPGWRLDRYLLREAAEKGITTASVIVGWDNTSSYSLPGAPVDRVNCWSTIQREELIRGADWKSGKIHIGGIPSYDGYIDKKWLISRRDYYQQHGLDPSRKLISYASSFVTFSPNLQNVEALVYLVASGELEVPSQLLIRLHPTHFLDMSEYINERERIRSIANATEHIRLVEPVSLGGGMGHYSGEDMMEKSSMMAYSDVMVTVYSTMVVEALMHGTPVISLCIDSKEGWPGKFTLPLSKIGGWPTHQRFRDSQAGREATNLGSLKTSLNFYLENPNADLDARREFLQKECTYLDGTAGIHTAKYLGSLTNGQLGK
jgi:hypothetical protein